MTLQYEGTNWWKLQGDASAKAMQGMASALKMATAPINRDNALFMRMYVNTSTTDISIQSFYLRSLASAGFSAGKNGRISWNIVKAAVDTLTSKIGKDNIRPSFLTNGAWVDQETRAELMSDWLYGAFKSSGLYKEKRKIFKDGAVFGTGIGHVWSEQKKDGSYKMCFERVLPDEIMLDPYDSYYGMPRTMYRVKNVSKDYLAGKGIPQSIIAGLETRQGYVSGCKTQVVEVVEGIHLPTVGDDGRHVIQSNGKMLFEEEWKRERFPYVAWRYQENLLGFWGIGVAEDLAGDQIEINRLVNFIKDCMIRVSNPRIFLNTMSRVDVNHLTNAIGGIVPYSGPTPPRIEPGIAVNGDVFAQLDRLWARGFEKIGLSQQAAGGTNPLASTASGAALREVTAIESERLADTQAAWEQWHCDAGQVFIDEAEDLLAQGHDIVVSSDSMDRGLFPVKYSDVKLPTDDFLIQCFPRSAFPKTPGARLAYVDEMVQKGYMTVEEGKELLNFPDLKKSNMLSQRHNIRKILEKVCTQKLKEKQDVLYIAPEPYMDLALAQRIGQDYYVALLAELPEETNAQRQDKSVRLDLVRRWVDDCVKLQQPPPAEMTPEAAMPIGAEMLPQGEGMGDGMPMEADVGQGIDMAAMEQPA